MKNEKREEQREFILVLFLRKSTVFKNQDNGGKVTGILGDHYVVCRVFDNFFMNSKDLLYSR